MSGSPGVTGGRPVIVVGGGIAGVACARRLHDARQPVVVLERSHALGGRMAVRTEQVGGRSHPVDLGAPYFTVSEPGFAEAVGAWQRAGLARPWTDTFTVSGPGGPSGVTTGPQRWSSSAGLRSLVGALAAGLDVRLEHPVRRVEAGADGVPLVDGEPAAAAVLAMPDQQAARLLPAEQAQALGVSGTASRPVLAVWAAWPQRCWPEFDGAFVNGSPVIAWVADSGRSRGDGAPVLVAHTTSPFAEGRLDDAGSAIGPVLAALPAVLGAGAMPAPAWSRVHRWSLASPRALHPAPFALTGALIGACGDAWGERSRVEQAWASGHLLAGALLERLGQTA